MPNLRQLPIYVWLAAVFPIASIASQNFGQVRAAWVGIGILGALLAATALFTAFAALLRSWPKAALASLVTTLAFYAYGPISSAVDAHWLNLSDHGDLIWAPAVAVEIPWRVSAGLLVCIGMSLLVINRLRPGIAERVTAPLNLIAVVLITFPTAGAMSRVVTSNEPLEVVARTDSAAALGDSVPRDIYYIVLDGYARDDVLATHYAFDNSAFLGSLQSMGFDVVDGGHSNYYWTFLSLASSLNMDYVDNLLGPMPAESRDPYRAYEIIRDSAVSRFLQQSGYRFVQLQSSWGATLANEHADSFVPCSASLFTNEFFRAIVEASWLRAFSSYASGNLANCHTTNMDSLVRLASDAGPKFVFAHFILPHHPYLFDRDGRVLQDATIANQFDMQARLWEDRESYVEQLAFVNASMLSIFETILDRSQEPPIILVHSDHGPQLVEGLDTDDQRHVRLANFAAYFAPGVDGELIPDGDTPVNYFRRVFNEYFGADFEILDNRSFYSRFYQPYQLDEVSFAHEAKE